jgi:hypothetical protein
MKNLLPILSLFFVFFVLAAQCVVRADESPDSFTSYIGQQWWIGKKREVLAVAESRLRVNPNDLASLLVCFDYASSYMDLAMVKDLIPRIRTAAAKINTPNFRTHREIVYRDMKAIEDFLPQVTEDMVRAEAYKGDIPNKPLDSLPAIKVLEEDNLVPPVSPEEKALFEEAQAHTPQPKATEAGLKEPLTSQATPAATKLPSESPVSIAPSSLSRWVLAGALILLAAGIALLYRRR